MTTLQPSESDRRVNSDDPLIDGAFIESDLGIARRSRCNYRRRGLLPPPDTNLLGKNLWRLSTYWQFKADLMAGKFSVTRLAPRRYASRKRRKPLTDASRKRSGNARAAQRANHK